MQEESKRKIQFTIQSNKSAIKNPFPKKSLAIDPNQLDRGKIEDKEKINILLSKLKAHHKDLFPFVKKLRSNVKDITETSHVCAVYLLLRHIFNNWNSFFILAENGRSSAAGNVLRMIKESNMQVQLFALESKEGDLNNMERWFSGEIIKPSIGREKMDEYSKSDLKELDTQIYQIESQFSHNAYSTILELVSSFTEDYDDDYVPYYRTIALLQYAIGSLEGTNIALCIVYSTLMFDLKSSKDLSEILSKYNPAL